MIQAGPYTPPIVPASLDNTCPLYENTPTHMPSSLFDTRTTQEKLNDIANQNQNRIIQPGALGDAPAFFSNLWGNFKSFLGRFSQTAEPSVDPIPTETNIEQVQTENVETKIEEPLAESIETTAEVEQPSTEITEKQPIAENNVLDCASFRYVASMQEIMQRTEQELQEEIQTENRYKQLAALCNEHEGAIRTDTPIGYIQCTTDKQNKTGSETWMNLTFPYNEYPHGHFDCAHGSNEFDPRRALNNEQQRILSFLYSDTCNRGSHHLEKEECGVITQCSANGEKQVHKPK